MPAPALGKKIPDFALASTAGAWRLKASSGSKLVVYFYPRDNTSGCTKEGEAFRDLHGAFKKANTVIVGISPDTIASHQKFKEKYRFPFELLSDPEEALCNAFEVMKTKNMYGKQVRGIERSTFLIGADGVLVQQWRGVKVPGHVAEVLEAVRSA
jgi:peroxiredoxin Q/BCP